MEPTRTAPPTTTTAPGDDGEAWSELKASPLWAQIQQYGGQRARGVNTQLAAARAELEAARGQLAGAGQAQQIAETEARRANDLEGNVDAFVKAQLAQLPPELASLCPDALPPAERLAWLQTNGQLLGRLAGQPGVEAARTQRIAGRTFSGAPRAGELGPPAARDHTAEASARMGAHQRGGRR